MEEDVDAYIYDEADEILMKHLFDLKPNVITGVYEPRGLATTLTDPATEHFFLTATCMSNHKALLKELFGLDKTKIHVLPSQSASGGDVSDAAFTMREVICKNIEDMTT